MQPQSAFGEEGKDLRRASMLQGELLSWNGCNKRGVSVLLHLTSHNELSATSITKQRKTHAPTERRVILEMVQLSTHGTYITHRTHNTHSLRSTHCPHGTHITHNTHTSYSTHNTHGNRITHSTTQHSSHPQ
ncbi:hypothetical protein FHG87_013993 [Trinorchestia longiramus]|nr:hypothetical protein FHG87_013993 [Trinorchestia longiramus]